MLKFMPLRTPLGKKRDNISLSFYFPFFFLSSFIFQYFYFSLVQSTENYSQFTRFIRFPHGCIFVTHAESLSALQIAYVLHFSGINQYSGTDLCQRNLLNKHLSTVKKSTTDATILFIYVILF